jgi:hypothetical protein
MDVVHPAISLQFPQAKPTGRSSDSGSVTWSQTVDGGGLTASGHSTFSN